MTGRLAISERDFQSQVLDLATLHGWRHFHALNMRGSDAGWPDLVLCRPPELLVVELKSETGRLGEIQREWLDALRACGVETALWRPGDFENVHARLRRRVRAVA
jgi:VRR-NUC domain